ncbi:hypothetical protein ACOME3_007077 [Neoechinorhynchus agilis]
MHLSVDNGICTFVVVKITLVWMLFAQKHTHLVHYLNSLSRNIPHYRYSTSMVDKESNSEPPKVNYFERIHNKEFREAMFSIYSACKEAIEVSCNRDLPEIEEFLESVKPLILEQNRCASDPILTEKVLNAKQRSDVRGEDREATKARNCLADIRNSTINFEVLPLVNTGVQTEPRKGQRYRYSHHDFLCAVDQGDQNPELYLPKIGYLGERYPEQVLQESNDHRVLSYKRRLCQNGGIWWMKIRCDLDTGKSL